MITQLTIRALALASACATFPVAAQAQEAAHQAGAPASAEAPPTATTPQQAEVPREAGALDDIVVTAQRRESSVQRTALAITAIGGEDLRSREINSIENLAPSLPNVNFGKNVGFARIAIRGVGFDTTVIGQEGRVAYHTDGVYISRPSAAIASFFDVNRVEVVRGPQGTLYGRNATAGAINVITNDPEARLGGYFHFFGAKGAFLLELSREQEAKAAFDQAIALANTAAEAAFIRGRLDRITAEHGKSSAPLSDRAGAARP